MIKEFNSLEEIEKYYDKNTNTYVFVENEEYIDLVIFHFDLHVEANIDAYDIEACNIKANNIYANNINANHIKAWDIITGDISACNIEAGDISANNISYHAVCFAYDSIKCKSIKGRRKNSKHFVLDGRLEVEEDE